MNELAFHIRFFFLSFLFRNASLFSTWMDQPPEIHGHARHRLVHGHFALWHGLWWHSLRGERANRQCRPELPDNQLGPSTRFATVPRFDPQPPRVLSSRQAEPWSNPRASLVLSGGGSDQSRRCFYIWLSYCYGHVFADCDDDIQRRVHPRPVTSSRLLHIRRILALLAYTVCLDGFFFAQQHDGRSRLAWLRVRHGSSNIPRGAMGSLRVASAAFWSLL